MHAIDKRTISKLGVPSIVLMAYAGKEVATVVRRQEPARVCVVCGKGNNGGDGWVAAWWLKHWGMDVVVISTVGVDELTGDAATASTMALGLQVPFQVHQSGMRLPEADVYVDAIVGTGGRPKLSLRISGLVQAVNESSRYTVSVDMPTGIDGSTGEVPGEAIRASHTVCIGLQKLGTAITPGCDYTGEVSIVDIGLDDAKPGFGAEMITAEQVAAWLPSRGSGTHKGTYGRVGIVVGDMQGAAVLAGLGAARVGAGLVILGHSATQVMSAPYEFVIRRHDTRDPVLTFHDCQSLVLGPGLGSQSESWADAVKQHRGPGVLDADGLLMLSDPTNTRLSTNWVITPHPKECARILGWSVAEVQSRRLQAAQQVARQTGAIVVLKGYRTVICSPDGRVRINPTGDASLATAGTGDILAGVIGGLLAQGLEPFDAAAAGSWIHGTAGELAGRERSKVSTMASDVVENISRAISLYFDAIL